ncbi:MAG: heat-inducible transcriptional repressor HrcA [Candidatus Methylopumilus sp.]|nr:heat-inducible transcriptional repressor HrcA [Candidatus Methylopumilus sp.]
MLDKRAQILLKTLIEQHINDGQPVGSRTLSQSSGLDLSPASIRNTMKDLEDLGFITSPHTSAGRIPTQMGYRLFVDSLLTVKPLDNKIVASLQIQMNVGDSKQLINIAANILSTLTQFAGVVLIPKVKKTTFKHLEFIGLSEKKILVIIVTNDGNVQNRVVVTEKNYCADDLIEAANYFNHNFSGNTFSKVKDTLVDELSRMHTDMIKLMTAAIEVGNDVIQPENESIVITGQRNLIQSEELAKNISSLRKIFEVFEKRTALMKLLDASQKADGIQIFIGNESGYSSLDECSLITSPYQTDNEIVGTLGVIGPKRMAYERIIPIVDITAKLLSNALSQH